MSLVCVSLCTVLLTHASPQSQSSEEIAIDVADPAKGAATATKIGFINGWSQAVDGQTISYHSAIPDATEALIVRAQRIAHSITWKTDPLPDSIAGDSYHFLWLAGIEFSGWTGSKRERTFDFFINGKHWFTFKNTKDETARKWVIHGDDGAALSFNATMSDKFGDLFGYMHLDLPEKRFSRNRTAHALRGGTRRQQPRLVYDFRIRLPFFSAGESGTR